MTIHKYYYFYGVRVLASDLMKAIYGMEKPANEDDCVAYNDLLCGLHKINLEKEVDNLTVDDDLDNVNLSEILFNDLFKIPLDFYLAPHTEKQEGDEEVVIGVCVAVLNKNYVDQFNVTPKTSEEYLEKRFKSMMIPKQVSALINRDKLQYIVVADKCDCCT